MVHLFLCWMMKPFRKVFLLKAILLVDSATVICWVSLFVILGIPLLYVCHLGVSGLFYCFFILFLMENRGSNQVGPDQMPQSLCGI